MAVLEAEQVSPVPEATHAKMCVPEVLEKGNLSCGREDHTEVHWAHSLLTKES